ncbi:PAS domain S-box protein [Pseudanabaena yagii]|uniref:histidine kinase n=1 Tax=Pseudanabaena yagii GIHE-NHR1 TaxID=2722753 RepID=A0ABX1LWD1_9CYAN|nr:PAS domain S-box protein [Pseudanabaena yagii]NMF60469.1 PAS domain S-box protein [Pseudanabaena yagii GIHE-NHR1]
MTSLPNLNLQASEKIQSLIIRNPLTIALDTSVGKAIAMMAEHNSSYIIVVDEANQSQAVGIFTERDVVSVGAQRVDLELLTMQSVISHSVISIQEESIATITSINTIVAIFQKHQIRHLPVLEGDRLVGLLIQDSLIELLTQQITRLTLIGERAQLALKGSNDAIWDWDLERNTKFFSPRWKQMRGFSEQEIGNSPDECIRRIHPDDYHRFMKSLDDHVIGETEFFEIEYRSQCKDGSYLWVLDRGQTVKDQTGKASRFIGFETDISDRKRAEEKLQKSEQRYRAIMDNASDAICLADPQGNLIEANHKAEILLGYTREELSKLHVSQIHPPDALQAVREHFQTVVQGVAAPMLESVVLRKDSSLVPVEVTGSRIELDGTYIAQGILRDISKRKRIEAALFDSEKRYQALFNHKSDAVFINGFTETGKPSNFIEVNQTACESLGYSREELLRMDPSDIMPKDFFCKKDIIETLHTQKYASQEVLHQTKDGKIFPVELNLVELEDSQGKTLVITSARNISDRKEYENKLELTNAELIRATRLKDEFLANMSHELRTPLNAILGLSEGLQEEIFGSINERQSQAIATIEKSGQHLLELISDILDLSKIEAGKLELEIARVNILQLCQSSLNFVKNQAFKKQIQLRANLSQDIGEMVLDERRIRQVLINLLSNAVKFTPTGGKVTLDVHYEPLDSNLAEHISLTLSPIQPRPNSVLESCPLEDRFYLCISVTDTGIGIEPLDQVKLFKPFVQIDSSLNRKYEGTGLGLALVKQIVEMHGGDINLRSQVGEGSCFTVRLPYVCIAPDSHATQSPKDENSQTDTLSLQQSNTQSNSNENSIPVLLSTTSPTILIAEDNEANTLSVTSYLEEKGYHCVIAQNGQEAITFAKIHQPQLILMDIQMPEMDGITATKQIRNEPSLVDIPIIALTALAMSGDRERCLEAGANDYLTKPVHLQYLAKVIEDMLAKNEKSK